MAVPSAKRISTWQDLRAWEQHASELGQVRARAMSEAKFANMVRRRRLRRLRLDHLDLLRKPRLGALALVELLAMATVKWGYAGIIASHQVLADAIGCSVKQVPIVIAWLSARGLVQQIRLWEPLRPRRRVRGGGAKHQEVAKLLVPGELLEALAAERSRQVERTKTAADSVGVSGSENLGADSSVAFGFTKSRSQAADAARDRQRAVDKLLIRDRVARAAEVKERIRRRTRKNDCLAAAADAGDDADQVPARDPAMACEGPGSPAAAAVPVAAVAPQLAPEALELAPDGEHDPTPPEPSAAPRGAEERTGGTRGYNMPYRTLADGQPSGIVQECQAILRRLCERRPISPAQLDGLRLAEALPTDGDNHGTSEETRDAAVAASTRGSRARNCRPSATVDGTAGAANRRAQANRRENASRQAVAADHVHTAACVGGRCPTFDSSSGLPRAVAPEQMPRKPSTRELQLRQLEREERRAEAEKRAQLRRERPSRDPSTFTGPTKGES